MNYIRKGDEVFSYNINHKEHDIYITVPHEIKYGYDLINDITELMKKIEESKCSSVTFTCSDSEPVFDKMGTAFLENVMRALLDKVSVYASMSLLKGMNEKVHHNEGSKFQKIEILEHLRNNSVLQCYCFDNENDVSKTVKILVEFYSEKNFMNKGAEEFLFTTIGEIFSNAFNHSEQKYIYFIYDIEYVDSNFYLIINITDFGKTIINNVYHYLNGESQNECNSKDCIAWAMKDGNTTRIGSGGHGLPTLVDYISSVEGELLIFSGDVSYHLSKECEIIRNTKGEFNGTSVSMKIPLFRAVLYDEDEDRIVSIGLEEL